MLHYGKSSGIISDNELIHLSLCYKYYYTIQGRNERVQGGAIPGNRNHYGGAEWLRGAPKISNNVTNTSFNAVNLLP